MTCKNCNDWKSWSTSDSFDDWGICLCKGSGSYSDLTLEETTCNYWSSRWFISRLFTWLKKQFKEDVKYLLSGKT